MPITEMRRRLQCLGWHPDGGRQLESGRWRLSAACCGHTIIAFADSRDEVWSAACSMAMKLTRSSCDSKTHTILRTGLQPLVFEGKLLAEAISDHYLLRVFVTTDARYVAVAARVKDGFQAAIPVPEFDGVVDILRLFDGSSAYVSTFPCVADDKGLFQAERLHLVDDMLRQLASLAHHGNS